MDSLQNYKSQFAVALQPFLEMLREQRTQMRLQEWSIQVEIVRLSISRSPEQYLGQDIPSREATLIVVSEIFEEFLSEHSQRSGQGVVK